MENPYSGGTWMMIPNNNNNTVSTPSSSTTSIPNQDLSHTHLQQQQQQQQFLNQQRHLQQQQQQHQSLASHFHLLHLVENLADVIENGTRDQHSDVLVNELTSNFEKCQQLLNSISGSISSKAMTVEGQKRKLEESEQLLNQRRELIAKFRTSVDELVKADR
ncbi:Mediator of rna polymerase ii transcription subunit [Thalictrum thalictroides]|uniref:Mediator of rna polymerase ii transcription subunit n=1 Tax=Thalictrum thalictroides TaxID=46969 RepID=A0A7J6V0J0_THATH|nr:Mediator of rna polymerase ii transcription subunit [Thalictrum thalictroides]